MAEEVRKTSAGRGPERVGYGVRGADGKTNIQLARGKSRETNRGNTLKTHPPRGSKFITHWHVDVGPKKSNGMVDNPEDNGGYGDTQGLKYGLPQATVSNFQVGWHEIVDGRLQFSYPEGALSESQQKQIQLNLDLEQKKFEKNP